MANDNLGKITYAMKLILEPQIKAIKEEIEEYANKIATAVAKSIVSDQVITKTAEMIDKAKAIVSRDANAAGAAKATVQAMNKISSAEDSISNEGISILKKTVGLIEDIHQRLVSASPLLRTIESLFNLAMQLFFMPLGNLLAETMIPAVIDLVQRVTDMWASFEGKSLGQILEIMLKDGAQILGGYFLDLGKQLENEGTIFGSISSILKMIGTTLQSGAVFTILSSVLGLVNFILSHFKELISLIVAFKAASLYNQLMTMAVIATSNTAAGKIGAGLAVVGSVGVGYAAGTMTHNYLDTAMAGTSTDETASSGLSGYSSNNVKTYNVTNNFNGITDANFKKQVVDIVNEQSNNSKLYSRY